MKTSSSGIAMIAMFEQYHDGDLSMIGLQPKMCPAGIWTVGLGHALINKETGKWLKGQADYKFIAIQYPEYLTITKKQADELLKKDLISYENRVTKALKVPVTQYQFDALVSYVYNVGWSNTMFSLINNGAKMEAIVNWWKDHYITANGKVLKGLVWRRSVEADLFRTGIYRITS